MRSETLRIYTTLRVMRFDPEQTRYAEARMEGSYRAKPAWYDFQRLGLRPYCVTEDHDCNLVTLAGWAALLGGIAGTTIATKYSATTARIGIGSSVAVATPGMVTLNSDTGSGSTTSYFQLVSSSPVIATGTSPASITFTASFAGGVANFPWNEFGTDNGNASGVTAQGLGLVLLNAGQSPQGTKISGETWVVSEIMNCGFPSNLGTVS